MCDSCARRALLRWQPMARRRRGFISSASPAICCVTTGVAPAPHPSKRFPRSFLPRAARGQTDSQILLGPALRQMKPRERQMLWLAHAEGYSHREIAKVMGLKRRQHPPPALPRAAQNRGSAARVCRTTNAWEEIMKLTTCPHEKEFATHRARPMAGCLPAGAPRARETPAALAATLFWFRQHFSRRGHSRSPRPGPCHLPLFCGARNCAGATSHSNASAARYWARKFSL